MVKDSKTVSIFEKCPLVAELKWKTLKIMQSPYCRVKRNKVILLHLNKILLAKTLQIHEMEVLIQIWMKAIYQNAHFVDHYTKYNFWALKYHHFQQYTKYNFLGHTGTWSYLWPLGRKRQVQIIERRSGSKITERNIILGVFFSDV